MHIYVYIRHPLWRRPPDRSISNDPLMENIHPLNLRWKLKKMVWIWPKLLGPWNLLNSHDSEYTMRILTWIYCCWIHILLKMLILTWKLYRCVVLFKWFGAISLSAVECFGRCGWAWDLGDHSPLVTLFNYKMMKLPSGWKKTAQFTKNSFRSLWRADFETFICLNIWCIHINNMVSRSIKSWILQHHKDSDLQFC